MDPATIDSLPGGEIVRAGLRDLVEGRGSADAFALQMAATRLRAAGLAIPVTAGGKPAAHRLYEALAAEHGDAAHSRYNAVVGRMVSFARAAERAQGR